MSKSKSEIEEGSQSESLFSAIASDQMFGIVIGATGTLLCVCIMFAFICCFVHWRERERLNEKTTTTMKAVITDHDKVHTLCVGEQNAPQIDVVYADDAEDTQQEKAVPTPMIMAKAKGWIISPPRKKSESSAAKASPKVKNPSVV